MSDAATDLHPLHVRVTSEELEQVHEQAREAGHATTSAYLRGLLGLPLLWRGRPTRPRKAAKKAVNAAKRRVPRKGDTK